MQNRKVWVHSYVMQSLIGKMPAKGTVLWREWWWPWAKVSVHEISVKWILKIRISERNC